MRAYKTKVAIVELCWMLRQYTSQVLARMLCQHSFSATRFSVVKSLGSLILLESPFAVKPLERMRRYRWGRDIYIWEPMSGNGRQGGERAIPIGEALLPSPGSRQTRLENALGDRASIRIPLHFFFSFSQYYKFLFTSHRTFLTSKIQIVRHAVIFNVNLIFRWYIEKNDIFLKCSLENFLFLLLVLLK